MRPVNLLPQEQRRRPASESSGKAGYAALGVLALLLAMVVAYVMTSNSVTERESEAETARVEADRLEAENAKKSSFTGFEQIAQTRMQSVASVAAGRFDWERLMRELARVVPEGSWLQATDASVVGAESEANAADPTAAVASSGPTANLVGCTPDQSDVARMMVRLRQMHRVEEVELKEAAQENPDEDPSFDSCGSSYRFDLTVKFSAAPVKEAPRGATRVPASLGGGS